MGYDLHITRAEEWSASTEAPIHLAEWESTASQAPGLRRAGSVNIRGADTPVYAMHGGGPSLVFEAGRIVAYGVRSAGDAQQLVLLADGLNARVVGDDGEEYGPDGRPVSY